MKLIIFILISSLSSYLLAQDGLILKTPRGNEKFEAGQKLDIVWEGNTDKYLFTLEYSFDNSITWKLIEDSISTLKYTWTTPDTITDGLLIRVTQTPFRGISAEMIWSKTLGGSLDDFASNVIETRDGDFVTIGVANSNDGDVPNVSGERNLWLIKLSNDGEIIWNKSYGGTGIDYGYDILELDDGGFLAVGWSSSNDLDIGENFGGSDGLAIRLDSEGNILWKRVYGGFDVDYFFSFIETSEGDFVFVGSSRSFDNDLPDKYGETDVWVIKVDSEGDIIWSKNYGGSGVDIGYRIVENDNSLYVIGLTGSNDFDIPKNNGLFDYLVLRIDHDGELIWANNYGGSEIDWGINLLENTGTGITAIGYTDSDDGDIDDAPTPQSNFNAWIIKVDSAGTLVSTFTVASVWSKDLSHSIRRDLDGNYLISGSSDHAAAYGADLHGRDDAVIYKIDTLGKIMWYVSAGGIYNDVFYDAKITSKGEYITAGRKGQSNELMDLYLAKFKEVKTKSSSTQMSNPSSIVKPILSLNRRIIDMGELLVGESKDSTILEFICNTGNSNLNLIDIKLENGDTEDFSISNIFEYKLLDGQCIDLNLSFTPLQSGDKESSLSIYSNAGDYIQEVQIIGRAIEIFNFEYFAYLNEQNSSVIVTLILEESTEITLEIYDILGRRIIDLYSGEAEIGRNEYKANVSDFQSGRYYIKLTTPTITKTEIIEVVR